VPVATTCRAMANGLGVRMRIDERVREVHLSHFCPGGVGVPVTTSGPVGLDTTRAAGPQPALDAAGARVAGRPCGRCGQPIMPGQDARRRAAGAGDARDSHDAGETWVHESCPPR
jgi:hypothetical protein